MNLQLRENSALNLMCLWCPQAKIAASGMSVGALLGQKAALERELVHLLNRHEELSIDLPWHMHHVCSCSLSFSAESV